MHEKRNAEADKPGVIIQKSESRNYQPNPREPASLNRRRNRPPIPAARVAVNAFRPVQIAEIQILVADNPIIRNQNSGNRTESARIPQKPRENITARVSQ